MIGDSNPAWLDGGRPALDAGRRFPNKEDAILELGVNDTLAAAAAGADPKPKSEDVSTRSGVRGGMNSETGTTSGGGGGGVDGGFMAGGSGGGNGDEDEDPDDDEYVPLFFSEGGMKGLGGIEGGVHDASTMAGVVDVEVSAGVGGVGMSDDDFSCLVAASPNDSPSRSLAW